MAGGIKSIEEAQAGLAEMRATLGAENYSRVEQAAAIWRDSLADLLKRDVKEGFITQELFEQLRGMYPWYVPIRYQELIAKQMEGMGTKSVSVTRSGIRRLSEVGLEEATEPMASRILRHFIQSQRRVMANRAASALVEDLRLDPVLKGQIKPVSGVRPVAQVEGEEIFRRPPGEIRGTISYMEAGKRKVWKVPPEIARMAKGFQGMPLEDIEGFLRVLQMPFRHTFVTYNPAFMAGNMLFDTTTVAVTRGILPHEVAANIGRNLRGIFKADPEMAAIIKEGGDVIGWHGRSAAQVIKDVQKSGNLVLHTEADWKRFMTRPWELMREVGHAVEYAPRRAAARRVLGQTGDLRLAAMAFRDSTVDFPRMGTAMRLLNGAYLFLNPAVHGTLLPLRALRDIPAAKYGVAGLVGSSLVVYSWNRQFPEYADIPTFDKYGGLLVMIPSSEYDRFGKKVPHYIKIIPMLRELAAFTSIPTYILSKLDGMAPEDTGTFLKTMVRQLNPVGQIVGGGLPVPTVLGELLTETAINYDAYRNRPIIPLELQGLPSAEQYDETNSEVARRVGQFLNWSPKKIDHVLRSGIGWDIVGGLDALLRRTQEGKDPNIVALTEQLKDIQELVPPESIELERRKYLGGLTASEREAVLKEERTPEPRIPFAESVMRRFYRKLGGNIYSSSLREAEKATGISPKQTRQAGRLLGDYLDKLQATQEQQDAALENGDITREQWRGAHSEGGKLYAGALGIISLLFPKAAQVASPDDWAAWQESVTTLAGSMPDRRSKGELLYVAWRSIPMPEIAPGIPDFETLFTHRDEFRNGLSLKNKDLLDEWRTAFLTSTEKEYDSDTEQLRDYWRIEAGVKKEIGPELSKNLDLYSALKTTEKREERFTPAEMQTMASIEREIRARKENMRRYRPEVDAVLVKWYGAAKVKPVVTGETRREVRRPTKRGALSIKEKVRAFSR